MDGSQQHYSLLFVEYFRGYALLQHEGERHLARGANGVVSRVFIQNRSRSKPCNLVISFFSIKRAVVKREARTGECRLKKIVTPETSPQSSVPNDNTDGGAVEGSVEASGATP